MLLQVGIVLDLTVFGFLWTKLLFWKLIRLSGRFFVESLFFQSWQLSESFSLKST